MKRRFHISVRSWSAAILTAALLIPLLGSPAVYALDVPPAPTDIPVVDQTNTLTQDQKKTLADHIAAERKATGNQIAILMIPSLQGDAIEDYSLRVARGWSIGQKDRDSGVLLLIAKDDRKLRIEVGYGLEGALTDARSGRIIRDRITPKFREGKFYEGINEGLNGIITAIHGEADPSLQPEGATESHGGSGFPLEVIFWGVIFIPIWLGSMLARTKSWWAGGVIGGVAGVVAAFFIASLLISMFLTVGLVLLGLLFDWLVSKNYRKHAGRHESPSWWAGGPWIGGGGGGNDGGFGGFGGGSFGGGGSSGSW